MTKEQVFDKLKEIFRLIVHNGVDVDKIELSSNVRLDLGVNSVAMIYLALAIERDFNIDMHDVTYDTFATVNDVLEYVYGKVNK